MTQRPGTEYKVFHITSKGLDVYARPILNQVESLIDKKDYLKNK